MTPLFLTLLAFLPPAFGGDVIINEIHYHPPAGRKGEEFVELFNRGTEAADIGGWSFRAGIDFIFPDGCSIPAAGHLALARDARLLRRIFGKADILGDFRGSLSNGGERLVLADRSGAIIDALDYDDRPPFPAAADGSGPSLERIAGAGSGADPACWAASRAPGRWLQAGGGGEACSKRLIFSLEGPGEAEIDGIEVLQPAGDAGPPCGEDFESGRARWKASGNHAASRLEPAGGCRGPSCLKIISSGRGGAGSGQVEVEVDFFPRRRQVHLRFWMKSISGRAALRAHFSGSALEVRAGRSIAEPTPGLPNSAAAAHPPPSIRDLKHTPARPVPGEPVAIAASIRGPRPIALAELLIHASPRPGPPPGRVALLDDGRHGDGAAGDGIFGAWLPPQLPGSLALYSVLARDAAGLETRFPDPLDPTPCRGVFIEPDAGGADLPAVHIILEPAALDSLRLDPRTPVEGAAVFDGEVYPGVRIRHRGQTSLRAPKKSWKIRFRKDRRLPPFVPGEPERRACLLDASWNDGTFLRRLLSFERFAAAGLPCCRVRHVEAGLNGEYWGLYLEVERVDEDFLRRNRLGHPGSILFKSYSPAREASGCGFELRLGPTESREQLAGLLRGILPGGGGPPSRSIEEHFDAGAFLDHLAILALIGSRDHLERNYYLLGSERGLQWNMLPWDLDLTWGLSAIGSGRLEVENSGSIFLGTAAASGSWNGFIEAALGKDGAWRDRYLEALSRRLLLDFSRPRLEPRIRQLREDLRRPAERDRRRWAAERPGPGAADPAAFDRGVDRILEFIEARRRDVLEQIRAARADPAGQAGQAGQAGNGPWRMK